MVGVTNVQLEQKLNTLVDSVSALSESVQSSKTELGVKIDGISERLDGYDTKLNDIERSIQTTDERVGELSAQVGNTNDKNRDTFADLTKRVVELEAKLKALAYVPKELEQITENVENRTNRQLRETLIFKNVPENEGDDESYDETKELLATIISNNLDDVSYDDAFRLIKRCHRERDRSDEEDHYRKGKRFIFAAMHSWDLCQTLINKFRQKGINDPNFSISVEQKYGPLTTRRRQLAWQLRKELKDNGDIESGYVKFPAKLIVNYTGEVRTTNNGVKKVYKLHTDFSRTKV